MKDKEEKGARAHIPAHSSSPGKAIPDHSSSLGKAIPDHSRALGKAIKVIRAQLDLSRADLAERTGLSYPYISEIESGKKSGSSKSLMLIAKALGMRLQDLYETADRLENDEPAGALQGVSRHGPKSPVRGSPWFRDSGNDPGVDAMAAPAYSLADMAPPPTHEKPYEDDLRRELHHLIDRLSPEDLELVSRLISRLNSRT